MFSWLFRKKDIKKIEEEFLIIEKEEIHNEYNCKYFTNQEFNFEKSTIEYLDSKKSENLNDNKNNLENDNESEKESDNESEKESEKESDNENEKENEKESDNENEKESDNENEKENEKESDDESEKESYTDSEFEFQKETLKQQLEYTINPVILTNEFKIEEVDDDIEKMLRKIIRFILHIDTNRYYL